MLASLTILAILLYFSTTTAQAQFSTTITVNTTDDELNTDGDCSLREAVEAANSDTAVDGCPAGNGWDIIDVPAGTYLLNIGASDEDANADGDLDILESVTIQGAGSGTTILDGNAAERILDVDPDDTGEALHLYDVTVTNGSDDYGAGVQAYYGLLVVRDSIISNNTASSDGGGLYSYYGTIYVYDSTVDDNQ